MIDKDKHYQVFISSTFVDLMDERQAVLRGILEVGQMPAGMELFPAADDEAWQLIRDVIDASDYYIVIVGGRYGSTDRSGLSFTEREYEYALSTHKPVLPFLHGKPESLPREKTDTEQKLWKQLLSFRKKLEGRHTCQYWTGAEDLRSKVIGGLISASRRSPAVGWIRADRVPAKSDIAEILALRKRLAEVEAQAAKDRVALPLGAERLQRGDDRYEVDVSIKVRMPDDKYPYKNDEEFSASVKPTWNQLFAAVAPVLIDEVTDEKLRSRLNGFFYSYTERKYRTAKEFKGRDIAEVKVSWHDIDTCVIQLRAIGLIRESDRRRSVKDTTFRWRLTPYGDHIMTQLRALLRDDPSAEADEEPMSAGVRPEAARRQTDG